MSASSPGVPITERPFRDLFQLSPIGMALAGIDGRYVLANATLERMLGHEDGALAGLCSWEELHPDDVDAAAEAMGQLARGQIETVELDLRHRHTEGHYVWLRILFAASRGASGEPDYLLSQARSIADRGADEALASDLGSRDPLTGLLNRRGLESELQRHAANTGRYGPEGGLLVLDIDRFTFLTDSLGPNLADEILTGIARVLTDRLRSTDIVARTDGDEFAVLLPRASAQETHAVGRSLLEAIRNDEGLRGGRLRPLTISIGAAMFTTRDEAAESVLVDAQIALVEAKEGGRDRLVFANPLDRGLRAPRTSDWSSRLAAALRDDRFELFVQPILDLSTNLPATHELLIRLRGDEGEVILPGAFLAAAERSDLIMEIDRWVVQNAIGLAGRTQAGGHPTRLAVNLSGRSVGSAAFGDFVEAELRNAGIDTSVLTFEIDEATAMANVPGTRGLTERLRRWGCATALDNFGAGFGSVAYLKQLPFDVIKIDGQFVRGLVGSPTDRILVDALARIARGMGKTTVGEFASDAETLALLRRLGVDHAQGYHVGMPAPVEQYLVLSKAEGKRQAV